MLLRERLHRGRGLLHRHRLPDAGERWNGTNWSLQRTLNPAGTRGSFLYDVACTSRNACTAVGSSNLTGAEQVTLAERWNGKKWSIQRTRNAASAKQSLLESVFCASRRICTAVGEYSLDGNNTLTLAERWNGSRWSIQKPPNPPGAHDSELSGVSCPYKGGCTAVGHYYTGTTDLTLAEHGNDR